MSNGNYDNENPDSLVQFSEETVQPEQRQSDNVGGDNAAEAASAPKKKPLFTWTKLFVISVVSVILLGISSAAVVYLHNPANDSPSIAEKADPQVVKSASNDVVEQLRTMQLESGSTRENQPVAKVQPLNTKDFEDLKSVVKEQNEKIEKLISDISQIRDQRTGDDSQLLEGSAFNRVAEQINRIAEDQKQTQSQLEKVEGLSKSALRELDGKINALQVSVTGLEKQKEQKQKAKESSAKAVTGNELKLVSVSPGFAFIQDLRSPKEEPFSLTVGEMLRGHGRVQKITGSGCIHTTRSKLQPVGGICSEG
ncbi:hypothetical protein [Idiomarina abyssalis]|uniref:Uncharacterized protein n=1 Tax=Idiomarina abyssalis TaxID=86102 RepID=A0A8I1GEW6_9GAMM|nr:hypothetical protein [Idiomarina abyssalis]MBJ7265573.1 hypothetical protein [Idiomarina abyssalis]MBJ7316753.1 hypothetical protein [Idiomarina abyssalis]